ncbi:hypothetical protein VP01_230g1 [Puccinia sorghi]|uniref:Uncharacterized protein n=1 Tax=Puccinia sorghi TaxID=27349 RepID=A0A0L6V7S4_9BASI|nr:hypothetical protein VP01_230g1 [Puccinia sorghi]
MSNTWALKVVWPGGARQLDEDQAACHHSEIILAHKYLVIVLSQLRLKVHTKPLQLFFHIKDACPTSPLESKALYIQEVLKFEEISPALKTSDQEDSVMIL